MFSVSVKRKKRQKIISAYIIDLTYSYQGNKTHIHTLTVITLLTDRLFNFYCHGTNFILQNIGNARQK